MANKHQIRRFYSILNRKHLRDNKEEIVEEYTDGRTTSVSEMKEEEIQAFIDFHSQKHPMKHNSAAFKGSVYRDYESSEEGRESNQMRRKIIAICRDVFDMNTEDRKADMRRIYACVEKLGYLKKSMNSYTHEELRLLVSQFEKIGKSVTAANARKKRKNWKVSVFDDDGNEIEFDVSEFMNK